MASRNPSRAGASTNIPFLLTNHNCGIDVIPYRAVIALLQPLPLKYCGHVISFSRGHLQHLVFVFIKAPSVGSAGERRAAFWRCYSRLS